MTSSPNNRQGSDAFTPELLPFGDHTIRRISVNGTGWLSASDLILALQLNHRTGIRANLAPISEERFAMLPIRTAGGLQAVLCVREDGLSPLSSSMTLQANAFEQWVADRGAQSPSVPVSPVSPPRPSAFQRLASWAKSPTGSPVTA